MEQPINSIKRNKRPRLKSQDKPIIQFVCYAWVTLSVLFSLLPLFLTIINSFKSNGQIAASIFALPSKGFIKETFNNYSVAWKRISRYMLNSIIISFVASFVNVVISSIMAYIFVRKEFYGKEMFYKLYIFILLVPSILGMSTLYPMVAESFHLKNNWLGIWLPVVSGGQAGALFLFRTFFNQQPKSLYESAMIDGANDIRIYLKLTIPLALPILLLNFIGTFGAQYNDFLWPSLLLEGKNTTLAVVLLSFSEDATVGKGAVYAAYLIASIPLIATTIVSLNKFQSGEFASGMKL